MQKMIYMSDVTGKEYLELQRLTQKTGSGIIKELISNELTLIKNEKEE